MPTTKSPECDLTICRSAATSAAVSESESLAPLMSSAPATVAVLVASGALVFATATVSVMFGAAAFAPIAAARVQVTSWPLALQLQPEPLALT